MGDELRYGLAACQVDQPNPTDRAEMARNTARMVEMVDMAVEGYGPFMDVKLLAFPEFGHAAPIYPTAKSLLAKLAVPIPNEHTTRLEDKARELGVYIQTASFLEEDPQWPGKVFNTTCLLGPEGLWYKYRKVNPWVPWEVHTSPHDLADYEDELFPVAQTPIGCIGAAICYDWLFPEPLRQLTANGAEILVRVSAYMDPWGATPPMDWWDDGQSLSGLGKYGVRARRQSRGRVKSLSAFFLAGRLNGGRFRRPHPRPSRPRARGENRRLRSRYRGVAAHPQAPRRPPHLGPPAQRGRTLCTDSRTIRRAVFPPRPTTPSP